MTVAQLREGTMGEQQVGFYDLKAYTYWVHRGGGNMRASRLLLDTAII